MHKLALYVDVDQDLFHTSYIYTGLFGLAQQRKISLEVRYPAQQAWNKLAPGTACVHVEIYHRGFQEPVPVCFDLHDKSSVFYHTSLDACAVYFKRSYYQADVDALAPVARAKVLPFGLTYPCTDHHSYLAVARGVARAMLQIRSRPSGSPQQLVTWVRRLVDYCRLPRPADFEWSRTAPKEPTILFQPRLWEQEYVAGESADVINEQRATLIRELRHAFGDRFRGGLVSTPLAERQYPNLIAETPPRSYLQLARRSLVGVYTRGLHHSTAWKLGEYLAASMCVVAEPPRNQFPTPLEADRHFLALASPAECVEACDRILSDTALQQEMREAAYAYYSAHVEPTAHLLQCIERIHEI